MMERPLLIDTHAHLSFPELRQNAHEIVRNAHDCDVTRIIHICTGENPSAVADSMAVTAGLGGIFYTVGVHPEESSRFDLKTLPGYASLLKGGKVVAIGEVGLDFHYPGYDRARQEEVLRSFIRLAMDNFLPLVLHQRESFEAFLRLLKEEGVPGKIGFVFHCFGGNRDEAEAILSLGGLISITGIITFKKAQDLRRTVAALPLERIMLETDSPFLSPEPKRGKKNEPANVVHIARKIAEIKGSSFEEVARITTSTAIRFFGLK